MPFKLRLKRSRQYNVVSKSLFVICVELLDGNSIECTLSAESSGQECLDSVCQRLGLQQPEFFGLRYTWRHGGPGSAGLRWVELERPLKRQLDKHARDPTLLLRVMYYVSGVNLIHDEMTRYHYFLQLKMDVIEGRMTCDAKQAVSLASYSMQAEFGNHDPERHTAEYLKDFAIFPKHLTEQGHLEALTDAVIRQHSALAGLAQGTAEEFYILAAQQLDGYGQETFIAKDDSGAEVVIGVSLMGIIVAYEVQNSSKFYRWKDITNVINHKRHFGIECQVPFDTIQFLFPDPESAKYVWRMCVHQHTFYMQNEQAGDGNGQCVDQSPSTLFRSAEEGHLSESREELDSHDFSNWSTPISSVQRAQSTSCLDLSKSSDLERLRALLPSYRPAPDYETAVQMKYSNASQTPAGIGLRTQQGAFLYSSQPEIHQSHLQEGLGHFPAYKHYPDVTADVKRHLYLHEVLPQSVPTPAPVPAPAYSTPELDAADAGLRLLHLYSPPTGFTPLPPPPPYPVLRGASSSTPDLASQTPGMGPGTATARHLAASRFVAGVGRPVLQGPPQVSGSSPDLVSSRSLGLGRPPSGALPHSLSSGTPLRHNAAAHRTYTDLATAAAEALTTHPTLPPAISQAQRSAAAAAAAAAEPIYENVPHPWAASTPPQLPPEPHPVALPELPPVSSNGQLTPPSHLLTTPHSESRVLAEHAVPQIIQPHTLHQQLVQQQQLQQHQHQMQQQQLLQQQQTQANQVQQSQQLQQHHQQQQILQQQVHSSSSLPMTRSSAFSHVTSTSIHMAVDGDSPSRLMDTSTSSAGISETSTKGKTKRKWVLLGGGGKGKGKSNTLGKEKSTTPSDSEVSNRQHRWSTGLPRLPLPPTISKETMCQLLERKLVDSQLFFEFEKIPKKKQNADFSTALHPDNEKRNRYKDVLPYEENRVRLIPTRENKFGYINASHITATVGNHQRFYIAAQGPLPQTVHSFWQMVWEADVYLVVMLCAMHEDGVAAYCPAPGDRGREIGDFQVWRQFSQETGHCITTKLRLYHSSSRRVRGVWHLQYMEWGEQGCPLSVGHFLGFLEELSSVRQHTVSEIPAGHNRNPPVLVHCSAGVGRTGVAILCDLLLFTLDHNQELDIPRVAALLRHQRMLMVQTVAQYRFVYTLLIYYLKHSRLI